MKNCFLKTLCLVLLQAALVLPLAAQAPSYSAEPSASADHPDTDPPGRLLDGKWHSALEESVAYAEDVTITVDFGQPRPLGVARIRAYQKSGDYEVASLRVAFSDDMTSWTEAGSMDNAVADWKGGDGQMPVDLYVGLDAKARYVRLHVKKAEDAKRILLGEIMVGPKPEPVGQLDTRLGVWVYEYATMPGLSGKPKTKVRTVAGKVDIYEVFDWSEHDPALKNDPTHRHHRIDPVKMHWVYQMPEFTYHPAEKTSDERKETPAE